MQDDATHNLSLTFLPVRGQTAREFLQGYLTCDCTQITATELLPMALCNLKGRVVANGWATATEADEVGLILETSLVSIVANMLTPYARFHRCELPADQSKPVAPVSLDTATVQDSTTKILGTVLPGWGLALDPAQEGPTQVDPTQADPTQADHDGQDLINQASTSERFFYALAAATFPLISQPTTEQFLPQVLNLVQVGAVDFDKGCYLGQEIVARAQFRGAVKKQLALFQWQGTPPVLGQAYTAQATDKLDGHLDQKPGAHTKETAQESTQEHLERTFESVVNWVCAPMPGQTVNDNPIQGIALGITRT